MVSIFVPVKIKAENTKFHILEQSAQLINIKGYAATSLGDITAITGLTKGAIYGHFKDKEELALKAFDYNFTMRMGDLTRYLSAYPDPVEKLLALINYYRTDFVIRFWQTGGCPVINTGVEVDDQFPVLKEAVNHAITHMLKGLNKLVSDAHKAAGSSIAIDIPYYTYVIFSAIQGALLTTKTTGDTKYLHYTLDHLEKMIRDEIL